MYPERECRNCEARFKPTAGNQRHCSESCRLAYKAGRKRLNPQYVERHAERERTRYRENRDEINAKRRARRVSDPEFAARLKRERARSYARNRDKRIGDAIRWQQNNPDKVAMRYARRKDAVGGLEVSDRSLRRILDRQENRCAYCNRILSGNGKDKPESLQWDHVVPLSRGGRHTEGNLVAACRDCNLKKGRKTVMEWRATRMDGQNKGDAVEDLRKSIKFIQWEIERLENERPSI